MAAHMDTKKALPTKSIFVIAHRFEVREKIGSGAFGTVYEAKDRHENRLVAIKLEPIHGRRSYLQKEIEHYRLMRIQNESGYIQPMIWNGACDVNGGSGAPVYRALVMPLMGPNLHDLCLGVEGNLSACSVIKIAQQMIRSIQFIHDRGLVHRDIKPDNFVVGLDTRADTICLIDFGLAKRFIDENGSHIPHRTGCDFVGNYYFSSVAVQRGIEPIRRDDFESIGYVLAFLARKTLPWRRFRDKALIADAKAKTKLTTFCPKSLSLIGEMISCARKLPFGEKPDYEHWMVEWGGKVEQACSLHKGKDCRFEWENR